MANINLAAASGYWHPERLTSFICPAVGDYADKLVLAHGAAKPPKRASKKQPAQGPSNPCNQRCRECAMKLSFMWSSGHSERVLVGPDITVSEMVNWAQERS